MSSTDDREQAVTDAVIASFAETEDERLHALLDSLTRHLHAFAREVRLTPEEWEAGIAFLTRVGHITDERRQEFILLSDVLGLSMLTVAVNAPADPLATESTVFGPFYVQGAPEIPLGGDIAAGAKGTPCWVEGTVTATTGEAVADAVIDVWEADDDGLYDVQRDGGEAAGRGRLRSGSGGAYRFWSVRPSPYPIPDDGPVGDLLDATGRSPMRPAHLHFRVVAPGFRTLVTHLFVAGDAYLGSDAVFGVKDSLVVDVAGHPAGSTAPDGSTRESAWAAIHFDIVLERS